MKKIILTIILLLKTASIKAQDNDSLLNNVNIKAGLSIYEIEMRTNSFLQETPEDDDEPEEEDEIDNVGIGFYSSVNYRFTDFEVGVFSDIVIGVIDDPITFTHNDGSINGRGHFRLINIGPQIKYHTPYHIKNKAHFYVGFGPTWSLQTFVFKGNSVTSGEFDARRRISFENYGATFTLGLEESYKKKSEKPWFIEGVYSYMISRKVSILDASNIVDVITLSTGESNDFRAHYFMVRFGVTLF